MDRIVLMRMDLDRYEAQLIPDLQCDILTLRHVLRRLVEAGEEAEQSLDLEASTSHRGALHEAQQLLEERNDPSRKQSTVMRLELVRRTRRGVSPAKRLAQREATDHRLSRREKCREAPDHALFNIAGTERVQTDRGLTHCPTSAPA